MPSYAITLPSTSRADTQRTWVALTLAALLPVWSLARALPGFLDVGQPVALDRAPSLWSIVRALPLVGDLPLAGLAMASAIGAGAWLAAVFIARPPRGDALPAAALLIALTIPSLLPATQTIDYAPAIVFAIACQRRLTALVIGGIVFASIGAAPLGALAILAAIALTARSFLTSPANDNGLPIPPIAPFGSGPAH